MSKKRPWMPLYIADFLVDTQHLTASETGAYLLLIMHYWMHGKLPVEDAKLARIARMEPYQWSRSKTVIKAFFVTHSTEGALLHQMQHSRVDAELARAAEISNKRKGAAVQMHLSKDANAPANAHTLHTSHLSKQASKKMTVVSMNGTAYCPPMEVTPSASSSYFFEAGHIRLNEKDFKQWETAFKNINLRAELMQLSDWPEAQGKKWFHAVKGALAKKDRDALDRQKAIKAGLEAGRKPYSPII